MQRMLIMKADLTVFFMLVIIVFYSQFQITFVRSFTIPCNSSVETVQRVSECPTNLTAYDKAAEKKNCSAFVTNTTKCASFQYHCVLSEDLKYLVEVCAPSFYITGYACAKFSSELKGLIRVEGTNCSDGIYECPFRYFSTDAYKYPHCYTNRTDIQHSTTELSQRGSTRITLNVVFTAIASIIVIVITIAFCLWMQKSKDENCIFGLIPCLRKGPNEEKKDFGNNNGCTEKPLLSNHANAKSGGEESDEKTMFCCKTRHHSLVKSNSDVDISNDKSSEKCDADGNLVDKNVENFSPPYDACQNGRESTVQRFVDKTEVNLCRNDGTSKNGHEITVQLSPDNADVNLSKNDVASLSEHERTLQLSTDEGNNVIFCRNDGASVNGLESTVQLSPDEDPDVNLCKNPNPNPDGESILTRASRKIHDNIVTILESR